MWCGIRDSRPRADPDFAALIRMGAGPEPAMQKGAHSLIKLNLPLVRAKAGIQAQKFQTAASAGTERAISP
jgi:hypothetical protein